MIPLRDENPSSSVPLISRAIIAVNCIAFVFELTLGPDLKQLIYGYGFIPERLAHALTTGQEPFLIPASTLITSMFLHGGWAHLLGNMWYLWIFGDNIEDRLGKPRFIIFYFASGIAAALAHYLANPGSSVPTVGASGAIAGVLGAYAVTFPGARIVTLIPFIVFFQIVALPALLVLGFWFVYQFLIGAVTSAWGAGSGGGGVAWWAHIGGFAFGIFAVLALGKRPRSEARLS